MSEMTSDTGEKLMYLPSLRIQMGMTLSSASPPSSATASSSSNGEQALQRRAHFLLTSVSLPKAMSTCLTLAYQVFVDVFMINIKLILFLCY